MTKRPRTIEAQVADAVVGYLGGHERAAAKQEAARDRCYIFELEGMCVRYADLAKASLLTCAHLSCQRLCDPDNQNYKVDESCHVCYQEPDPVCAVCPNSQHELCSTCEKPVCRDCRNEEGLGQCCTP